MNRFHFLIGFIIGISHFSLAHTGYPETVVCPVCSDSVVFHHTMSMTTFGTYLDFQKKGAIGYYYEEMINACKNCHYSGYYSDFDTSFKPSEILSIRAITSKYADKKIDDAMECAIAAELKIMGPYNFDQIANIYLVASYLLRDDSLAIERRKDMQRNCINFLLKALDKDEYDKDEIASINYLLGELYRRTSNFEQAVKHFDLAITDRNKKKWVKDVAIEQKALALKKDDNNKI